MDRKEWIVLLDRAKADFENWYLSGLVNSSLTIKNPDIGYSDVRTDFERVLDEFVYQLKYHAYVESFK